MFLFKNKKTCEISVQRRGLTQVGNSENKRAFSGERLHDKGRVERTSFSLLPQPNHPTGKSQISTIDNDAVIRSYNGHRMPVHFVTIYNVER